MDDIIAAVDDALPKFNRHLLVENPRDRVNESVEFLSTAFEEAMKFLRGIVKYDGYRVLTPEERVQFELTTQKTGAPIANSELQLVAYDFIYDDMRFTAHLYLPYMIDGQIIIKNTRYSIMHGITEKVFSRSRNGVTVRVIRQPLEFWRSTSFYLDSVTSDFSSSEFVIGTKLHMRNSRKKDVQATVIHYLLCRFGFVGVLNMFGANESDFIFTDKIDEDTDKFEYFYARKRTAKSQAQNDELYLKVSKEALKDPTFCKLAANLLYVLVKWDRHTVEYLYDKNNTIYRIYLGKILYGNIGEGMEESQANTHIFSVDFFLDPITKKRMETFGVKVDDIWGLLQYVFTELDRIIVHMGHQNLYEKRITVTDLFMIETFVTMIYRKIYSIDQNLNRIGKKELRRLVASLRPYSIRGINKAPNVQMIGTSIINGNMILSYGLQKIRLAGSKAATPSLQSPDVRFHPSIAAVESLVGFSGSNIAATGLINPFIEISDEGGIIRPDYADEIDGLADYLPYRG